MSLSRRTWLACLALVVASSVGAATRPTRRALLVGIDDYSASTLKRTGAEPPARGLRNLGGAVNDVHVMRDMLGALYGFEPRAIVTLTNQTATRAAILQAIDEHLLRAAAPGDVLLFYFAGHGSQVRNLLSDEADKLDESIVPADSRLGARDIRDKELRRVFNGILDHGARLTVILDSCHSGSGGRGLYEGRQRRGVKPDLRDVADGASAGPRPEDRGALILSAAQDSDSAWETFDDSNRLHGAFSWAWASAVRDAVAGEPALETFLRAKARLRVDRPDQEPVMAGNADARLSPFLGVRKDRREDRAVIAVESVDPDGVVTLQGGWANGLTVGCELRPADDRSSRVRLEVTAMDGLVRCFAKIKGSPAPVPVRSGTLLEIAAWAAPPGRPLRVWVPRGPAPAMEWLTALAAEALRRGVRWVDDPVETTPTHVLRWNGSDWELLTARGDVRKVEPSSVLTQLTAGSSLFVQLPLPPSLDSRIGVTADSRAAGIECVRRPDDADYLLAGRFVRGRVEYAWVHPGAGASDQGRTCLPLRTKWQQSTDDGDAVAGLKAALIRLRRIHGWQVLSAPPDARFPYHLAIRRTRDGHLVTDGSLLAREQYGLVLRASATARPQAIPPRYVYAFVVDSHGRSVLLFPRPSAGSVENHFPLPATAPLEIPLGEPALFTATEPYGVDTYFLLSTDEPLANALILQWDGVRADDPEPSTPLEELLALTPARDRGAAIIRTSLNWSIERLPFEVLPQRVARSTVYETVSAPLVANTPPDLLDGIGPLIVGGRVAEARVRLKRAVEIYRIERRPQREAVALLLLGMADAMADDADDTRANLRESASKLRTLGDPLGAWMATSTLATFERNKGQFTAALARYQEALGILREADAPGAPFTIETFLIIAPVFGLPTESLEPIKSQAALLKPFLLHYFAEPLSRDGCADVLIEVGQLDKAEKELTAAAEASRMFGGLFDASISAHFGDLRRRQGRYDEAREGYRKALGGAARLPMVALNEQWVEVGILSKLADLEIVAGRTDDALAWNDKALHIVREAKNVPREASILEDRGNLLLRNSRFEAAEEAFNQSLDLAVKSADMARQASVESDLGSLNMLRGTYGRAAAHLEESVALYHKVNDSYSEASVWTVLSEVYILTAANGSADFALEKAHSFAQQSGFQLAQMFVPLLETTQKYFKGEATGAELNAAFDAWFAHPEMGALELSDDTQQLMRELIALRTGPPDSTTTANPERTGNIPVMAGLGYLVAGRRLLLQGESAAARELWLKALSTNPNKDLRVGYLALVAATYWKEGNAEGAIRYFTDAANAMEIPIDDIRSDEMLASYLGSERHVYFDILIELLARSGRFAEAFDFAERARARAFLRLIGSSRLKAPSGADADLMHEAEVLRVKIASQEHEPVGSEQLRASRDRYQALMVRVQASYPEYASLTRIETLHLEDVRRQLPLDTTLVSYFVSSFGVRAWVLDRTTFEHVALPVDDAHLKRIVCWADQLGHSSGDSRGAAPIEHDCGTDPATSDEVYEALIAPIRGKLHNPRLVIVPHGVLHYVPFAALRDAKSNHYLIDDFTIMYAPSASALRFLRAKETPVEGRALVLGDPAAPQHEDLPGAQVEAVRVAHALGTTAKLGAEATESLLHHLHGNIDLLHIAAHASYNSTNPLFSRIELAPGGGEDGSLNVHEILSDVDLSGVNLVVLSACRSGVGRRSDGDEIVGLTRALLYAGSPGVISTLWNIDDEVTAVLMEEFYTRLLAGASAADALRGAQLELLHNSKYREAKFWAAFSLSGDPQGRWKK